MCVQCEIKRESCCLATPALLDRGNVVERAEAPMVGMDGVITVVGENKLFLEKPSSLLLENYFCSLAFENILKIGAGTTMSKKYHILLLS